MAISRSQAPQKRPKKEFEVSEDTDSLNEIESLTNRTCSKQIWQIFEIFNHLKKYSHELIKFV